MNRNDMEEFGPERQRCTKLVLDETEFLRHSASGLAATQLRPASWKKDLVSLRCGIHDIYHVESLTGICNKASISVANKGEKCILNHTKPEDMNVIKAEMTKIESLLYIIVQYQIILWTNETNTSTSDLWQRSYPPIKSKLKAMVNPVITTLQRLLYFWRNYHEWDISLSYLWCMWYATKNAKPKKEGSYLSGKIFDTKEEGVNDLRTVRQVFFTNLIFNAVIDSRVLYDMCMIYQYTLNNFFRTL